MNLDYATMAEASLKVLVAGLVFGAGLPALFAAGVRMWNAGTGAVAADGTVSPRRPVLTAAASVCFAVIVLAVLLAIAWITKSSLDHYLGWKLFGGAT